MGHEDSEPFFGRAWIVVASNQPRKRHPCTTYEEVLSDMTIRDARDSTRDIVPTQAAPGALIIDTTQLTTEEVIQVAYAAIDPVFAKAAA